MYFTIILLTNLVRIPSKSFSTELNALIIFSCTLDPRPKSSWPGISTLVTFLRNFRKNRGPVTGILKGYIGLSTAIFTDLCSALFASDPAKFLLMLAIIPFVVCLTAVLFLRETPPSSSETQETKYLAVINALSVIIALYLLGYDISGTHGLLFSQIFAVILIILLLSPVSIPIHLAVQDFLHSSSTTTDTERNETEALLIKDAAAKQRLTPDDITAVRPPVIGEEHTVIEALKSLDFWMLFASFLCGVGTGLTVMNILGQMGLAMGYSDVSIFVSLTSIWGFFGRIFSVSLSEYFIKRAGTPKPIWNAASQILMPLGYIPLVAAFPGSLYIGSIVVGICYGFRVAITVPTASELFGLKYYGLIYNILILNLPLGSFLFSGILAGFLSDAQATRTAEGGNTCFGAHCYRLIYIVMAIACVVGFGLDVLLSVRTKGVYRKIYDERLRRKHWYRPIAAIKDQL